MTFPDQATLRAALSQRGVPLRQWGDGAAKTVEHLWAELNGGESELAVGDDGQLWRRARAVCVRVHFTCPGRGRLLLVEDHQRFLDGRANPVRRRGLEHVGEKLTPGEDARAGARRALAEELGVHDAVVFGAAECEQMVMASRSYPGLVSQYDITYLSCELPSSAFDPDGYTETQPDKVTVFRWKPMP